MPALDLASAHRGHLLRSELWQDDVVEHRLVVAHALRALLGAGILLEVVRREVPHRGCLALGSTLCDGVLPPRRVREHASRMSLRLVEGQQRSVLPNRHALGLASVAASVLDDVTADACRLDPEAEAGEGAVPHHELLWTGLHALHNHLGELLAGHD